MIKSENYANYPEVKSYNDNPKGLIVFLHGVGSDGHDLISLVPYMQPQLQDYYFISPHGIEKYDMAPYGRQWFSLKNRDPNVIKKLLKDNVVLLENLIKDKQGMLGLTNKDTIIIGFSQGTMIGLYLNLIQTKPFSCMVGFSGRLIAPIEPINKITPICLIHGQEDDIVDVSELDNINKYLDEYNIPHNSYKIKNLAHSIDVQGIEFAINFIQNNKVV